jgi:hypothetical protein
MIRRYDMSVYTDNGYKNRADYLESLSDEFGISLDAVYLIADVLGPNEDFDGLVVALEDYDIESIWS